MNRKFEISGWTVDPYQCLLIRKPENLKLEPKTMALLVVLAEAEGELVSRRDIFDAIWPGQHVTDYALNTLIASLRKSLGKTAQGSGLIETRPKIGYRLSQKPVWLDEKEVQTKSLEEKSVVLVSRASRIYNKHSVLGILFVSITIFLVHTLYVSQKADEPKILKKTLQSSLESQVQRYLVNVTLSYSHSELDSVGNPLCSDFSYETLAKAIYINKQWKIVGEYFTYELKHQGASLLGVNETHRLEYQHQLGKEIDEMNIKIDEGGKLTGQAGMKVFDLNGKLLCTGNSLFIGSII